MIQKEDKRAQFYLIAAAIIIAIIISLAGTNHDIITKQEPEKQASTIENLNYEALKMVDNLEFTGSTTKNIETLSNLFSSYISENTNEDFELVVLYNDNAATPIVKGKVYKTKTNGGVNADGSLITNGRTLNTTDAILSNTFNIGTESYVNVTTSSNKVYTTKLEPKQNFIIVLTTSNGFNEYVTTNFNKKED